MKFHGISSSLSLSILKQFQLPSTLPPKTYSTLGCSKINFGNKKAQGPQTIKDLPILIPAAGNTHDEVQKLINSAEGNCRNLEFLHLHQTAYKKGRPGSLFRGYGLVHPGESQCSVNVVEAKKEMKPVWMIFPGLGSQCHEMTKDLMKMGPFSESIVKSKRTIKNLRQDLDAMLKPNSQHIFTDTQAAMVSLTAVQIAIFDTLKYVGFKPDGIIGHSTGELLCAYADGCLSAEETILAADAHGRALKKSQTSNGLMASVGLGADELQKILPIGLEIVGNNSFENTMIAGAKDSINEFVQKINAEGKNAEVMSTCGTALHFSGAQESADLLKKHLRDIIRKELPRSSKWISTSVAKEQLNTPLGKFASPNYFANALKSPSLFLEALKNIPSRAIIIEISPKAMLQKHLQEVLSKDCVYIAPLEGNDGNKLINFYDSIGQIYNTGRDVAMTKLYPPVTSPVYKPVK